MGRNYNGNRRNAKNKPIYVSYRCSYRRATSSKVCDNKEIRKEYIEEYVLSELERKIFNDKAIQSLVYGINQNLQKRNKVDDEKKEVIAKELKQIDTQIVTEEDVKKLLNNFSGYVISRNIPECKKFIQYSVKEVVVYKEHIEVIFNVSFL